MCLQIKKDAYASVFLISVFSVFLTTAYRKSTVARRKTNCISDTAKCMEYFANTCLRQDYTIYKGLLSLQESISIPFQHYMTVRAHIDKRLCQ
jgi:hypothetical protein